MIEHYYNELLKVRNGFKHIEKVSTLNNRKCDIKKALKLIIDNKISRKTSRMFAIVAKKFRD